MATSLTREWGSGYSSYEGGGVGATASGSGVLGVGPGENFLSWVCKLAPVPVAVKLRTDPPATQKQHIIAASGHRDALVTGSSSTSRAQVAKSTNMPKRVKVSPAIANLRDPVAAASPLVTIMPAVLSTMLVKLDPVFHTQTHSLTQPDSSQPACLPPGRIVVAA